MSIPLESLHTILADMTERAWFQMSDRQRVLAKAQYCGNGIFSVEVHGTMTSAAFAAHCAQFTEACQYGVFTCR